ncbi:MAG TPA: DNA mismatch repair protein MutS [Candidatus Dojkabacteria bacterium]|nr:DNA mismatch repair protein MutS [Candidatus Dojkabacteria bacterium]HQF36420.1 DNA mismatch repair protein MutS [Candidatus Dojkabacteria bacterium]
MSVGGYIKGGFSEEFDTAFAFANEGGRLLKELEERLIKETNISTIKVKRNKIWGHYVEITNRYKDAIPSNFIHRQTLVNASRFTTAELIELEKRIIQAENSIINLELSIFNELVESIYKRTSLLQKVSIELGYIDLISNFAYISVLRGYVKPEVLSISDRKISITNGRHPIVSEVLKETFIPNSTTLDEKSFVHIITGPNMSGKSTYLRQVALIILMAQIGCFVPAESCEFSVCDRVFTRIGASDDISSGRSTFMVEMSEMSNILKNASRNSLVLLDEIGRGTSTYDGVSLAWAIAKHIAEKVGAFTLFATHYHELIQLKNYTSGIENFTVSVLESDDKKEVTFLYKIEEGETDKSYGVYVAKIAGIPEEILDEAEQILSGFEQKKLFSKLPSEKIIASKVQSVPLFSNLTDPKWEKIKEIINSIQLDDTTPMQALSLLAQIKDINKE